jgi:hypothetical protein
MPCVHLETHELLDRAEASHCTKVLNFVPQGRAMSGLKEDQNADNPEPLQPIPHAAASLLGGR